MRMLNSAQEVLLSYPVRVIFAGFESNTLTLARNGWDLSLRHVPNYYMELALRNERAGLFGLSRPVDYMYFKAYASASGRDGMEYIKSIVFDVIRVGSGLFVQTVKSHGSISYFSEFNPIDPYPSYERFNEDIRDFNIFKTIEKSKDIIIDPNDVPGMMEMILKAQLPEQKAILARAKSRENMKAFRYEGSTDSGRMDGPRSETMHAQIISISA